MSADRRLYPFQEDGVSHLLRRNCVLLADEMGLGKTVQAVVAIDRLVTAGAIRRVLIVCPASLSRNWRSEIRQWAPHLSAVLYEGGDRFGMLESGIQVLIGSYETITSDLRRSTREGDRYHDIGLDVAVLDEAQRIKDPMSLKARVLSHVLAGRRWAISGTPLENRPRDLASVLRFLFPNEFGSRESLDDGALILSLRDACMVRRSKSQVGRQLPSKTVSFIPVGMAPDQAAEYEQACNDIRSAVCCADSLSSAAGSLLGGLQTLRRIAVISSEGESEKLDLLCDEIEEIAVRDEKVVVFSTFAQLALPVVANRLRQHGALLYTGEMTKEQREEVHQQFIADPAARVMCASLKAAGVGLTWTVANHVYQLDIWWNPQVLRQAEDRVHRIGQTRPVFVKRLVSEGTIEEAIREMLLAKEELFELVINERADDPIEPEFIPRLLSLIGLKLTDLKASGTKGSL